MPNKIIIIMSILSIMFLAACNSKIIQEAEKVEEENKAVQLEDKELRKEQEEVLIENENEIDDIVEKIKSERETKSTVDVESVEIKDEYESKEDFAQYVAKILYDFHTKNITAEEYFNFTIEHGSKLLLQGVNPDNKQTMVEGFSHIQNRLNQNDYEYKGYSISEITMDKPGIYGYFYRNIIREDTELNYITTIVKQGDAWKFDSDQPSSGYNEKEGEDE